MPLQKQKISIPFLAGVDTKRDDKQIQMGSLLSAENIIFENPGKIKKRTGHSIVPIYDISNNKLDSIHSISPAGSELTAVTGDSFYAFSDSIDRWVHKGKIVDVFATSKEVVRDTKNQSCVDCAYLENTKVFVYKSANDIRYSVVDSQTDTYLVYNSLVKAGNGTTIGLYPKIATIQNVVFLFYVNNGKVSYKSFNIVNPEILSAEVDVITALDTTSKLYDVVSTVDRITIAYHNSGNSLKYFQIYSDLSTSSVVTKTLTNLTTLDLNIDSSNRILFSIVSGGDLYFLAIPSNIFADVVALTAVDAASANIVHASANFDGSTFRIYYELSNADTTKYLIMQNTISLAAAVGTPSVFSRGTALIGKVFSVQDNLYIPALHSSVLQPSYFILDSAGSVISTVSPSLGGAIPVASCTLPKIASIDANTVLFPSQLRGRVVAENGIFDTLLGINSSTIYFSNNNPSQTTFIADELHLANGIIHMYDGSQVVEHGFYLYPETISATSAASGGSLSDGQYQYTALYSWTDNKGQVHLSASAVPVTITLTGGGSSQINSVVVPTLRLTEKSNVVIELYRTENAGTIFYKVSSISAPTYNDKTVDSVTITDGITDAALISNEVLYSEGGVLENIIAPQASIIESFKNRIFLAGLENKNRIQYSKIRNEGKPVEFNDTLYKDVIPFGGSITAIKAMDDKVIIFKERAIFYMSGDGPNNLGEQDNFTEVEMISSDVGCKNISSVVLTPGGLFFQSAKGVYLLNRSLQIEYRGALVEKYNANIITAAKTVETKNLIIFTTEEGIALVYNYILNQWSTYTNMPTLDAEVIDNNYYYLRTDGQVLKSDESYSDNGTNIPIKMETGWLNFADVQGFQRVYRMLILGEFKSVHKLRVSVAYDFKDSIAQEVNIDTSDFIDSTTYGEYSPYGAEPLYGSDGNLMQIRINFQRQKCESIKITIEDITLDSGEALTLSSLAFVIGAKANTTTVNNNNRYAITN